MATEHKFQPMNTSLQQYTPIKFLKRGRIYTYLLPNGKQSTPNTRHIHIIVCVVTLLVEFEFLNGRVNLRCVGLQLA